MPIEVQIEKAHGKHIPVEETQRLARAYANEQIARQKPDFQRLGVLGDWSNPYPTMAYRNEADEIRTLGKLLQKGFIYRGLKPVNWCFDCGSALAEAEVEYEDRQDSAIDVAFPIDDADRAKLAAAFGLPALPAGPALAVIWTTTPWTIPANQALNAHPAFDYALVATPRGHLVLAVELVAACLARYGLEGQVVATAKGAALESIRFRHPFYDRPAPVYLGDYVTLDTGTGIVHSAPAYGIEDFQSCRAYGMKDDEMLNPVGGDGRFAGSLPFFGGEKIWEANPQIVAKLADVGALLHAEKHTHSYMHCWRHKSPIIYRATTQWFAGMDEVSGWNGAKPAKTLRELALAGIEATRFYPAWGKARLYAHDRQPARLDAVAAAAVGHADAVLRAQGDRRAAPAHAGDPGRGREARRAGRHRGLADARPEGADRRRRRPVHQDQGHARRLVRLRLDPPDGDGRARRAGAARGLALGADRVPRRHVPRGLGPAPRLVPHLAAGVVHAERRTPVQEPAHARLRRRRRRQEDVEVEGQRRRAAEGVLDARRRDPAAVGGGDRLLGRACRSRTRS